MRMMRMIVIMTRMRMKDLLDCICHTVETHPFRRFQRSAA